MLKMLCCLALATAAVVIGGILGHIERTAKRRSCCPYCACRENCNIGFGVTPDCPEADTIPMACMEQKR